MRRLAGERALENLKANRFGIWNRSPSSKVRSEHANDASNRIHDRLAQIKPRYGGAKLRREDPVFAMGSCFAREMEAWLVRLGGQVLTAGPALEAPAFRDAEGRARNGFFHRFTPASMLQEFQHCFDELPAWGEDALLFPAPGGKLADFNYATVDGADYSEVAVRERRKVARELVRSAARTKMVILTLGLIEAWRHKPSGLYANAPNVVALARRPGEFQLEVMDTRACLQCLDEIRDLLKRHHETGAFDILITVSPVPLSATFTNQDIVVANAESKAVLRAAAAAFATRHRDVHYFPSYEMVTYSAQSLAWREDRLHVHGKMVRRIAETFMRTCYQPEEFRALAGSGQPKANPEAREEA